MPPPEVSTVSSKALGPTVHVQTDEFTIENNKKRRRARSPRLRPQVRVSIPFLSFPIVYDTCLDTNNANKFSDPRDRRWPGSQWDPVPQPAPPPWPNRPFGSSSCCRPDDRSHRSHRSCDCSHRPPPPSCPFLCGHCCPLDAPGARPPI